MNRWSWIVTAGAALVVMVPSLSSAQQPAPGAQTAPPRPATTAPAATVPATTAPAASPVPSPAPAPSPVPGAAQPTTAAPARPGAAAVPGRGPAAAPAAARPGEVRRRSYAACNHAARRRDLSGGLRRSFITKCRLGLEKP